MFYIKEIGFSHKMWHFNVNSLVFRILEQSLNAQRMYICICISAYQAAVSLVGFMSVLIN